MKIETRDFAPHVVRCGWIERNDRIAMVILFGLHYIRGNKSPSFSITVDGYTNGRNDFGGCCHDLILKHAPDLADVVALHSSDMDGSPMHAMENGWYWLGGMIGGAGAKHHGGTGEYGKGAAECAEILANHLRISLDEAWKIAGRINKLGKRDGWKVARIEFAGMVDAMRPRWKAEAEAAIRKYGFGIYGDMQKTPAEVLAQIDTKEAA